MHVSNETEKNGGVDHPVHLGESNKRIYSSLFLYILKTFWLHDSRTALQCNSVKPHNTFSRWNQISESDFATLRFVFAPFHLPMICHVGFSFKRRSTSWSGTLKSFWFPTIQYRMNSECFYIFVLSFASLANNYKIISNLAAYQELRITITTYMKNKITSIFTK